METPGARLSRRNPLDDPGTAAVTGLASGLTSPAQTATPQGTVTNRLVTYPIPDGIPQNDSFTVKLRPPGGKWRSIDTYLATFKVINPRSGTDTIHDSSMAYFDFSGTVEVSVTYTKNTVKSAKVRPLSYGIEHEVRRARTVVFTLAEPRNLSIEVNGDIFDNLQLFAGAIEADPPGADDEEVIFFGPGVHTTDDGLFTVPDGKTVYLAGGAVLKAKVIFENVSNAKLLGRGVLAAADPNWGSIAVTRGENIEVDGITTLNVLGNVLTAAETKNLAIRNVRGLTSGAWGDGIDLFCCNGVVIDGAFLRTSDDCIAVYNHRWEFYGDSSDITVKNCTLWADVAHPVNIGTHGNTENPETISDLTFSNIDILEHREPQVDYQGCFALNAGDSNLIKDVLLEDIRVEDFLWGQLINMRVMFNESYNTSVGRGIENIYIKNLSYTGTNASVSHLVGYGPDNGIKNVTFENLVINGQLVSDTDGHAPWYKTADFVPMYVNEHVTKLRFIDPVVS
ncbi:glycosyl hydrolase family 28 protein [Streptomyces phaeochromogenes]|uniref:glycosyl hydrolase family 28 protein n=1 Tax=Streptomyces phaeochromogenes TaxID=1923 RepID=UPI0036A64A5B